MSTNVTSATHQGEREYQEDRAIAELIIPNTGSSFWLLAVMDGHAGSEAADIVYKTMADEVMSSTDLYADNTADRYIKVLRQSIATLNGQLFNEASGTTLSAVIIPSDEARAYFAVLGDSPVVIKDRNGELNVSPAHNCRSNIIERKAAVERGAVYDGKYLRCKVTGSGIQTSRSLGDRKFNSFLSRDAEIYTVNLGLDSIIMVASDGILDSHEVNMAFKYEEITSLISNGYKASQVVDDAIARRTRDNVTVIVYSNS